MFDVLIEKFNLGYNFWMVCTRTLICLFVYSRTSNFSAIWRLSPLPVTGLQILAYAWRLGQLSREGSLSCHTYCDTGPRIIRSHPTVGLEPPTQGSSDHCARRSNHCATIYMSIPCDKTIPWLQNFFTLWPWPCCFTYIGYIFWLVDTSRY
jgi:hypothetical protein